MRSGYHPAPCRYQVAWCEICYWPHCRYNPVSDRIMTLRINTKPCRINIVVVYAPTSLSSEEDIDAFYNQLDDVLKLLPKRDINVLIGDLNAKVGSTKNDNHLRDVVGKYGLGERNDRGEMFLQFCAENSLTIMNTCFENHPRRLYTWVMPGDRARNQIDYIAIARRWRSCISNTKTYPGADCGSDHKLLVAEMGIKLKKCHRTLEKPEKRLKSSELINFEGFFEEEVNGLTLDHNATLDTQWNKFKRLILSTRKKSRVDLSGSPQKAWITDETWKAIQSRKDLVKGNRDTNASMPKGQKCAP
ncbi:hypothetical protein ABMA27_016929 [Loxostege sticticalis]|uniref:Endonuclease/exonuclease/phosphatase domain-containing protein n=1 Tax=Loxostege sticticalis TaxID=481309 RepID=A0ABR3GYN0_LOXSC